MCTQVQFKTSTYSKFLKLSLGTLLFTLVSTCLQANEHVSQTTNTTTVYKVTHPDGSVSYSDIPQENATKMFVEPVITVPAVTPIKLNNTSNEKSAAHYLSLVITNPADGSAFNSGSGNVSVSTKIEPSLRAEDRVRFILNGREVQTQKSSTLQLTNISRGTHQLRVQVLDAKNTPLISSSSEFTIHRPITRSFKAN